jgi:hypothetical protein
MNHRPLDPRKNNIAHDANALDRNGADHDRLVDRFSELSAARVWNVVVAGGVRGEVQHPHTPGHVKAAILPHIFNLRAGLNASQQVERQKVLAVIQGNAQPGTHAADASHISEAAETGCVYFITHDGRVLKKRRALKSILPSLTIVTLAEFLEIFDDYEAGRRL